MREREAHLLVHRGESPALERPEQRREQRLEIEVRPAKDPYEPHGAARLPHSGASVRLVMDLHSAYVAAFGVGTTLLLLLLLRLAQPKLAVWLRAGTQAEKLLGTGKVFAALLISASAVRHAVVGAAADGSVTLALHLAWTSASALLGLVLLLATGAIGVSLLLGNRLKPELARGNEAAGLAAGASYVATGIVTSHAVAATDLQGALLSLGFFGLAQLALHGAVVGFRALTTYDDADQVLGENLAAAVSYAGVSIAVAIVVGRALDGDFAGWQASLTGFGGVLAVLLAFYPVRQLFLQSLLLGAPLRLRGGHLDEAIGSDRSVSTAVLEAATYVGTALAVNALA